MLSNIPVHTRAIALAISNTIQSLRSYDESLVEHKGSASIVSAAEELSQAVLASYDEHSIAKLVGQFLRSYLNERNELKKNTLPESLINPTVGTTIVDAIAKAIDHHTFVAAKLSPSLLLTAYFSAFDFQSRNVIDHYLAWPSAQNDLEYSLVSLILAEVSLNRNLERILSILRPDGVKTEELISVFSSSIGPATFYSGPEENLLQAERHVRKILKEELSLLLYERPESFYRPLGIDIPLPQRIQNRLLSMKATPETEKVCKSAYAKLEQLIAQDTSVSIHGHEKLRNLFVSLVLGCFDHGQLAADMAEFSRLLYSPHTPSLDITGASLHSLIGEEALRQLVGIGEDYRSRAVNSLAFLVDIPPDEESNSMLNFGSNYNVGLFHSARGTVELSRSFRTLKYENMHVPPDDSIAYDFATQFSHQPVSKVFASSSESFPGKGHTLHGVNLLGALGLENEEQLAPRISNFRKVIQEQAWRYCRTNQITILKGMVVQSQPDTTLTINKVSYPYSDIFYNRNFGGGACVRRLLVPSAIIEHLLESSRYHATPDHPYAPHGIDDINLTNLNPAILARQSERLGLPVIAPLWYRTYYCGPVLFYSIDSQLAPSLVFTDPNEILDRLSRYESMFRIYRLALAEYKSSARQWALNEESGEQVIVDYMTQKMLQFHQLGTELELKPSDILHRTEVPLIVVQSLFDWNIPTVSKLIINPLDLNVWIDGKKIGEFSKDPSKAQVQWEEWVIPILYSQKDNELVSKNVELKLVSPSGHIRDVMQRHYESN